jgi:hypothetical protein
MMSAYFTSGARDFHSSVPLPRHGAMLPGFSTYNTVTGMIDTTSLVRNIAPCEKYLCEPIRPPNRDYGRSDGRLTLLHS